MEILDRLEKALAARFLQHPAVRRIDEATLAAALLFLLLTLLASVDGVGHGGGMMGISIDDQPHDANIGHLRGDPFDQHRRGQRRGAGWRDGDHARIDRPQDFALEADQRTRHAHDGQYQSGRDAQEPVKLKQDVPRR